MDIKLALMAGVDIPIPELQAIIHQPQLKEIARMGEQNFFMAIHYLCLNKEALLEDESLLQSLTNFQVLMKVIEQSEDAEKKIALITLLSLLFPGFKPIITPKSIILNNLQTKQSILIDDNNYVFLQEILKQMFCISSIFQGDNVVYNPANEAAKKIADKLMKGRKRVAELKGKNQESVLSRYVSILTIGISSMSLENCLALTIYQLFDLVERYNLFIEWDLNLRVRLAGGDPKQDAENWMKNIH